MTYSQAIGIVAEEIGLATGLHYPPEKYNNLRKRVEPLLRPLGYQSLADVAVLIADKSLPSAHFNTIINAVTIGETRFYRDIPALNLIREHLLPDLVENRRRNGLRSISAWSAACATGPEAYTLAMLMKEGTAHLPVWSVSVVGTDINDNHLEIGRRGQYPRRIIRSLPEQWKEKYLEHSDGFYTVGQDLKQVVELHQLNIMAGKYPKGPGKRGFDIIACSNVLIYFSRESAVNILNNLKDSLAEDGILIVSAVESSLASSAGYDRCDSEICQVLKKSSTSDREIKTDLKTRAYRKLVIEKPEREAGPSTDADDAVQFFSLAAAMEELGEPEKAKAALRRAIYLQPNFVVAQISYAGFLEREGDSIGAEKRYRSALKFLHGIPAETIVDPIHLLNAGQMRDMLTLVMERRHLHAG